ncbi:hypothetical protein Hsw_3007 [Hymenobacter swuensis DY53]|uniref:Uncharacterized protein n=1 Tax=Hymenobacter swuensis DY53 TaxID=1227739 RepID=W8F3K4_9BACT|nr:hypothetical protein Hsw_3007 [Hymenobacter swuensis DY53]
MPGVPGWCAEAGAALFRAASGAGFYLCGVGDSEWSTDLSL